MTALSRLVEHLSKLPGIGKKSATRLAYHLLTADRSYVETLGQTIVEVQHKIKKCSICGSFTEDDPCDICSDPSREKESICVVEQPQDISTIESTRIFQGTYHVLQGVISPIDGIGPQDLRLDKLIQRIKAHNVQEVILATNPTIEGDTTALYIVKLLEDYNVTVTRLASGLPVGGDLEYSDSQTLIRSFNGRTSFKH